MGCIMSEYCLELKNVVKRFPGVLALNNVNLAVAPGKVHALMGENGAGKSTLMNCLMGNYRMDSGEILLNGESVKIESVKKANELGIFMIPQEVSPVLERSIMENLWLGNEPLKLGVLVDHKKMYQDTVRLLKEFGLNLDPRTKMKNLGVAQIQMLEIIKEVSREAKILIMDEPTSALTNAEVNQLFEIIRGLKEKGIAIIYISHKLEEIFEICDYVTVFRDGAWVSTNPIEKVTNQSLIKDMVGRPLAEMYTFHGERKIGNIALETDKICADNTFKDISIKVRYGEIIGLAGMVGAGRTEILEALYGLRQITAGTMQINGQTVRFRNVHDAIKGGIGFVCEDRKRDGIFPILSVSDNMISCSYDEFLNQIHFVMNKKIENRVNEYVDAFKIKTASLDNAIQNLSGGNQQKVLLGRCLMRKPQIVLLDEPTRGIDVGAKEEIYHLIFQLASEGKSVIIVSSEMAEIINLCDRVYVFHEGSQMGELSSEEVSQEKIMTLASGMNY